MAKETTQRDDFFDRMAIAEAHRKNSKCEKMVYGDYFGNDVRCRTCLKDCAYVPVGAPSPEEIAEAKDAIQKFKAQNF